jgi:ElaB/YqjD/DUF883 family membrane-anchored ribosome-binding protein
MPDRRFTSVKDALLTLDEAGRTSGADEHSHRSDGEDHRDGPGNEGRSFFDGAKENLSNKASDYLAKEPWIFVGVVAVLAVILGYFVGRGSKR